MKKYILGILFGSVFSYSAVAQHNGHNAHPHQAHHHERNEFGISAGAIYATDHKKWGTGVHLHYFRTLGNHSAWAFGGFAEMAWVEGRHYSVGAGIQYEPIERLHLGAFPGVTFARHKDDHSGHGHNHDHSHNDKWNSRFSLHLEAVYDLFHWNRFHLGPVIDYSWSKDDPHFMLGVHAAYCF